MQNVTPVTPKTIDTQVRTAIEGLPEDMGAKLSTAFSAMSKQAAQWMDQALSIVVRNEHDKEAMQEARVLRLRIREVRINAWKAHKELKAPSLKYSQTIDSIERMIRTACEPAEAALLDHEQFAERKIERERQERAERRRKQIDGIGQDPNMFASQCLEFTDEQWEPFLQGLRDAQEAKQRREREAEVARQQAALETVRLRQENARIQSEMRQAEASAAKAIQDAQEMAAKANLSAASAMRENRIPKQQLNPILDEQIQSPRVRSVSEKVSAYVGEIKAVPLPDRLPLPAREVLGEFLSEVTGSIGRLIAKIDFLFPEKQNER